MNARRNAATHVVDLGLMEYTQAWDYQTGLFQSILDIKKKNRDLPESEQLLTPNYLLLCEHPPVVTLGKSGDRNNLLATPEQLSAMGASYVPTNRGGDITFHGPGQLVVYPVIDLENFFTDITRYMRSLEEAVIRMLDSYGIKSGRLAGLTGVWLTDGKPRKICAMGVKSSRWVTMHGLALNVNVDLAFFDLIIPCGINDKAVTSMKQETGLSYDLKEVKQRLTDSLMTVFEMERVVESL
ncbi:MAG: lipoyl(octanoyl) transferase LipB [Cyclobacteriaceae bacterium]|nr:lipoyl(octanoyl) transferase LipB [Cyclobacteriaceae bacterium]